MIWAHCQCHGHEIGWPDALVLSVAFGGFLLVLWKLIGKS
jgi:hypothetical protein